MVGISVHGALSIYRFSCRSETPPSAQADLELPSSLKAARQDLPWEILNSGALCIPGQATSSKMVSFLRALSNHGIPCRTRAFLAVLLEPRCWCCQSTGLCWLAVCGAPRQHGGLPCKPGTDPRVSWCPIGSAYRSDLNILILHV